MGKSIEKKNDEKSCYDCRYYHIDPDCRGIDVCRNFKRKSIDIIVDNQYYQPGKTE